MIISSGKYTDTYLFVYAYVINYARKNRGSILFSIKANPLRGGGAK